MDKITSWRLIPLRSHNPYVNMAIDEALLISSKKDNKPPTLRLYTWDPASISIGYFQKLDNLFDSEIAIPIVRRMTGGGLILHKEELTYSITASKNCLEPFCNVAESYKMLTSFIVNAYCSLGLNATFAANNETQSDFHVRQSDICFQGLEKYDILIDGIKIGGNAQRRFHEIILQHGSIPLNDHNDFLCKMIKKIDVDKKSAYLNQFLKKPISINAMARCLIESFQETFRVPLITSKLDKDEEKIVSYLVDTKYKNNLWTQKKECPK